MGAMEEWEPVPAVAAFLRRELLEAKPSFKKLVSWLEGFDLPIDAEGRQPFEVILAGMPPPGPERERLVDAFFGLVISFLNADFEFHEAGDSPGAVWGNLLWLCGCLPHDHFRSTELLQALEKLGQRGILAKRVYLGLFLTDLLESAIEHFKEPSPQ
jgi:hypothetical protein